MKPVLAQFFNYNVWHNTRFLHCIQTWKFCLQLGINQFWCDVATYCTRKMYTKISCTKSSLFHKFTCVKVFTIFCVFFFLLSESNFLPCFVTFYHFVQLFANSCWMSQFFWKFLPIFNDIYIFWHLQFVNAIKGRCVMFTT
jgi:hypothetical protein